MTSITFRFKKNYQIFIYKFSDFFVRNFVFLTSSFTIFASFFSILRFVSIDRILHIVILTDVIDIWLSIEKFIFSNSVRIKITSFSLIKKSLDVFECSNQFFQFSAKKKCRNDFVTLFYEKIISENSNNCVFNFSICVISSSIDWLNFCLTCFSFWSISANRICSDFKCFCRKDTKIFHV